MKKTILIFTILFLLTSCSSKQIDNEASNEPEISEEETDAEIEKEETIKASSLKDFTSEQLQKIKITEKAGDRILFDDYLSAVDILSDTEAEFSDNSYETVRYSSNALYCSGFDAGYGKDFIKNNISEMKFISFDDFSSPYNITKQNTNLVFDFNEGQYSLKDIIYGYTAENIQLNCFICKSSSPTYDVIVDPAYMYGLPVYHSNSSSGEYTINGLKIESDTINFSALISNVDEISRKAFKDLGSDYVYAKITFDNINCIYGINSGYKSTASIKSYKLLTTDTERVLTRAFLFDNTKDKDPKMVQVYNALISNIDAINTDLTLGITLLDLDFDKTPEVLVTNYSTDANVDDFGNVDNEVADVDIYRIENSSLNYIDTLYNYHAVVYELGNIIGLKTLEDGSKAWFNMSYKNRDTGITSDTDYLFTLKGNELNFQEVFGTDTDGNYRYFGEPMVFTLETITRGDLGEETVYSWGDYKQMFGPWEIVGKAKQDYCKDMKETSFNLYSDWLSHTEPYTKSYKLELSDRMMSYNIAYLIDSFYIGSYNSNKQYFEYRFLGDYAKPVIYLYPTVQTDVSVKLELQGKLTCTYPEYNNEWNVTANPDGTLINKADGREYSYLFWEGKGNANWDLSKGFVVKGEDTVKFLQEKLECLGLTTRELNEFIVYWLPLLKDNKYNLISFQTTVYEKNAKLHITPEPDSVLRVFMAYKALDKYIEIPEQQLNTFNRNGFSVIEWGGTEIK